MSNQESLTKVRNDFEEVVKTIDRNLGKDYASKNPRLIEHLMDQVQREEDRQLSKKINKI